MHRILILDDELPSAQLTEQLLRKNFPLLVSTVLTHSVKDAVTYLNQNPVDLIFLDLQLNGESGFDLLDKTTPRKFDFICLSASADYALKAFDYNASGYLLKPINDSELKNAMSAWLKTRHINFENKQS